MHETNSNREIPEIGRYGAGSDILLYVSHYRLNKLEVLTVFVDWYPGLGWDFALAGADGTGCSFGVGSALGSMSLARE